MPVSSKRFKSNLTRDIRFADSLSKQKASTTMYEYCLIWELQRTCYHEDSTVKAHVDDSKKKWQEFLSSIEKAKDAESKLKLLKSWQKSKENIGNYGDVFPQCISSWPEKPFLSHPRQQREKWVKENAKFINSQLENPLISKLYLPNKNEPEKIHFGGIEIYGDRPLSSSVPLTLHINPNWSPSYLKKVIGRFATEIIEEASHVMEENAKNGAIFDYDFLEPRPLSFLKTSLKLLGHLRLLKINKGKWHLVVEHYGKDENGFPDAYQTEEIFWGEVRKNGLLSAFTKQNSNKNKFKSVLGY